MGPLAGVVGDVKEGAMAKPACVRCARPVGREAVWRLIPPKGTRGMAYVGPFHVRCLEDVAEQAGEQLAHVDWRIREQGS